eukprot:TRINITY_DN2736_c0_g1_i1.p1 TRINITY_DN2736_c0_g1~~TRINITY_DN2736_c0_g1_i1.p1  ORF type:complete len:447 (+),score=101.39 TRINITY_DN2736_c0_g1_i1:124-1464(+)
MDNFPTIKSVDSLPFVLQCHTQQGFDAFHNVENQDRHYYSYDSKRRLAWLGVFDGHAGSVTAEYVCSNIVANIRSFLPNGSPDSIEDLKEAIFKGVLLTESRLDELNDPSGTCLLLVCLHEDHLIVANVGDSRVVLGRTKTQEMDKNWDDIKEIELEAVQLSNEHNTFNMSEAKQARYRFLKNQGLLKDLSLDSLSESQLIEQVKEILEGDDIIEHGRLFHVEFTRSLGDFGVKKHCFGVVSPEPEITCYHLTSEDQFLIIGSDGVFLKVDNQTAIDLVNSCLKDPASSPYTPAQLLVNQAVLSGSGDDLTVLVLDLANYRENCITPSPASSPTLMTSMERVVKREKEDEKRGREMFMGLFVSWHERSLAENSPPPKRMKDSHRHFKRFDADASQAQITASDVHRIRSKFVPSQPAPYSGLSLFERHARDHQKLVSSAAFSRKRGV